jgi:hypothetical protein
MKPLMLMGIVPVQAEKISKKVEDKKSSSDDIKKGL